MKVKTYFLLIASLLLFTIRAYSFGDSLRVILCLDTTDHCEVNPIHEKTIEHIDSLGNIFEVNHFIFSYCDGVYDSGWRHSNDIFYSYDSLGRVVLEVDSQYANTYTLYFHIETIYDSSGNKTSETKTGGITGQPVNNYNQYLYEYDSLHNKTMELDEQWNTISLEWDTLNQYIWTYDSLSNKTGYSNYMWQYGTPHFVFTGYFQYDFYYDSLSNLILEYNYQFSLPNSLDSSRVVHIYDSLSLERTQFVQHWDTLTMQWAHTNRTAFEYDSLNRPIARIFFYCSDSACSDTTGKIDYQYDAFGHRMHTGYYEYAHGWYSNGADWTYYDSNNRMIEDGSASPTSDGCGITDRMRYTYNSDNQIIHTNNYQGNCNPITSDCSYYNLDSDSMLFRLENIGGSYCPDDTIHPLVTVEGGTPPYSYQWSPLTNMLDTNVESPRIITDTTIIYSLTVTDSAGRSETQSFTLNVYPRHLFPVTISTSGIACAGNPFYLFFNSDSLIQPWEAIWMLNGTNYGALSNDSVEVNYSGNYSVVLYDDNNWCSLLSDSVVVNFLPETVSHVYALGDTSFCSGQNVTLLSDSFPSVKWNTGDSSLSLIVDTTGSYFVMVIDSNGCADTSASIHVLANLLPAISLGSDTMLCTIQSITLDAGIGFANYLWQNGDTLQTEMVSSGIADTLDFFVMVTDTNGCSSGDTTTIIFDICAGIPETIQNIFSIHPNPSNGKFLIDFSENKNESVLLTIENLFGEKCFSEFILHRNQSFDLSFLAPGMYIFTIQTEKEKLVERFVKE